MDIFNPGLTSFTRPVMFATAHMALTSLFLCVSAASAAPGLSLHVSGPQIVEGIENLKLVATVTNVGDEILKLLKDPRSPLSNSLPADKFIIVNAAGDMPLFNGVIMKYTPSQATLIQNDDAFTVLAPGDFVDIEHDLWKAYDFTLSGPGHYSFEARNLFYYVNSTTTTPVPIYAHTVIHRVYISGRSNVIRQSPAPTTRQEHHYLQFVGCTTKQELTLQDAFVQADYIVTEAARYLQTYQKPATLYTTWFGSYTAVRYKTVGQHFTSMRDAYFASYTYNCTCESLGAEAYVNGPVQGTINICPLFWVIPLSGMSSQIGVLVHEASHFKSNGGCADYLYGQDDCRLLAKKEPNLAVDNAESHMYFALAFLLGDT